MPDVLPFAGLALVLGFKHSFDADHLIAVANFLRKAHNLKAALRISTSWAIGHMATAALVTALLYFFRESVLSAVLANFDRIIGVMLVAFGLLSLKDVFRLHFHIHSHSPSLHIHPHLHQHTTVQDDAGQHDSSQLHAHKHMFGIGILHGLASSDELLILLTASLGLASLGSMMFGVAVFSVGVVAGMMLFALFFSYPLLKAGSETAHRIVTLATASVSIAYGVMMLS